jgi:hypothetical protein
MAPRRFALVLAVLVSVSALAAAPKQKPPEVPPPPPAVIDGAELQGLDKISARITKFTVPFGRPVRFGSLTIRVADCRRNPPEEAPESAAFVDVEETQPGASAAQNLFHGWMFASSPALNPLEHPVYDVWVLDCSSASTSPVKPG